MSNVFTTKVKTNLDGVLQMTQMIDGIMMTGDNSANEIIVELYRGVDRVRIEAGTKIVGYFVRSDGYTLEADGTVTEDGNAYVLIPEAAYQVAGILSIAIRMFSDPVEVIDEESGVHYNTWNTKVVIATLNCFVQITETDSIIDVYHHIPDVQELLAYIDSLSALNIQMNTDEQARSSAEQTRISNEQGRVASENERDSAETARASAEQTRVQNENARIAAETARASAESIRATNETQRQSNESTRQTNESTRQSNESTRQSNEATRQSQETTRQTNTNAAIAKINGMTVGAEELAVYSSPTVTISEVNGHKHIQFGIAPGAPFVIQKIFASIAEMNAYTGTDIRAGQFVIISSNVEDPDNAKLYLKTESGFTYITDLSGSQGIQGPQGIQGIQGETGNGISGASLNNYKLTLTFTDGTSYTTPVSIRGEQGIQGETGNGISSVTMSDYKLTFNFTNGSSYTTPISIRGEQGIQGNTGNGIASASFTDEDKLQLTMTDGSVYTSPRSLRGPRGVDGSGSVALDYDSDNDSLTVTIN